MATTQHKNITDPDIHEAKGVAAAAAGKVYISDGAGSGAWRYIPHSYCYYTNIGTGTTYTTPASYTLVNPTTTVGSSSPKDFTHNNAGRLTYTGTTTLDVTIEANITGKHSSATVVDAFFAIYKNGSLVTGSERARSFLSGTYDQISILAHVSMATNDYVEVYTKTASGNVVVHAINLLVQGHI